MSFQEAVHTEMDFLEKALFLKSKPCSLRESLAGQIS